VLKLVTCDRKEAVVKYLPKVIHTDIYFQLSCAPLSCTPCYPLLSRTILVNPILFLSIPYLPNYRRLWYHDEVQPNRKERAKHHWYKGIYYEARICGGGGLSLSRAWTQRLRLVLSSCFANKCLVPTKSRSSELWHWAFFLVAENTDNSYRHNTTYDCSSGSWKSKLET